MPLLKSVAPIIRGVCTECGSSRNLWVSELPQPPCHCRDRGCTGYMEVKYTGPKAWIPAGMLSARCRCDERAERVAERGRCGLAELPSPAPAPAPSPEIGSGQEPQPEPRLEPEPELEPEQLEPEPPASETPSICPVAVGRVVESDDGSCDGALAKIRSDLGLDEALDAQATLEAARSTLQIPIPAGPTASMFAQVAEIAAELGFRVDDYALPLQPVPCDSAAQPEPEADAEAGGIRLPPRDDTPQATEVSEAPPPQLRADINAGLDDDAALQAALAASAASTTRTALVPAPALMHGEPASEPVADGQAAQDVGECAICTEALELSEAAMRCVGGGGRSHYFHAGCLTSWIGVCQSSGAGATCPSCRGPLQVSQSLLAAQLWTCRALPQTSELKNYCVHGASPSGAQARASRVFGRGWWRGSPGGARKACVDEFS